MNPYDAIPYTTQPRQATHPDRLATVGRLFGMDPAPLATCRMLEVGCGDGSNLIPIAWALPDAQFVGVDLAEEPIAAGNRTIAELGLRNITLAARDLCRLGEEYGEFDYIVAHGVYSWVPEPVRDGLMALCHALLAPAGIAFISYNTYPGRRIRHILREMMLDHTRAIPDNGERLRQARWILEFLRDNHAAHPLATLLGQEAGNLLGRTDDNLYHDDLGEVNHPVYFRDFAAHAGRHALQYLGDAELFEMFDTAGRLAWVKGGVVDREQYMDFLRARSFRQSLLCRDDVALNREPVPALMDHFLFSAPAKSMDDGRIEGLRSIRITARQAVVRAVTGALGDAYPLPLAFDELVPYAGNAADLREILFGLIISGFADLHVFDYPCEETVTPKPQASRLARFQASRSLYVTSACQHVVKLDEIARRMLCLLDGTRDVPQLVKELADGPDAPSAAEVRDGLPASLEWLARMGLLEA